MLNLSKDDRKQLREAIEAAYPNPADLRMWVDESLNQNLFNISTADSHRSVIFDLIKWAIAKGYIDELILALAADTNNPAVQSFCGRVLQQCFNLNAIDAQSDQSLLDVGLADWNLDITTEELQLFLPKQFSFQADVGTLRRGLELANSVCKITFDDRSPEASGTGVLIAPDLVLTNYHVFSREKDADLNTIARSARFEFGYVSRSFGESSRTQVLKSMEHQSILSFSPIDRLDYVLIRLHTEDSLTQKPVPLDTTTQLLPKSPLNILQHPEGEQMKVSLSNNGVVKINQLTGLVLYVNPTKCGSSGSPCFNQDWQLVALHHKEMVTSFGSIREGILFSAIYNEIKSFL